MENTIPEFIGLKYHFQSFNEMITELDRLAYFISVNSKNITDVDLKGLLIKTGFVDLTYIYEKPNIMIKIFGQSKKSVRACVLPKRFFCSAKWRTDNIGLFEDIFY